MSLSREERSFRRMRRHADQFSTAPTPPSPETMTWTLSNGKTVTFERKFDIWFYMEAPGLMNILLDYGSTNIAVERFCRRFHLTFTSSKT